MSGAASRLDEQDIELLISQCADASEMCASIQWVFGGEVQAGCAGGVDGIASACNSGCCRLCTSCREPVAVLVSNLAGEVFALVGDGGRKGFELEPAGRKTGNLMSHQRPGDRADLI
eukprot:3008945-Rhodomonas_salina.4